MLPVIGKQFIWIPLSGFHRRDIGRVVGNQPERVYSVSLGAQVDVSAQAIVNLQMLVRVIPMIAHLCRGPVVDEGFADRNGVLGNSWDAVSPTE